MICKKCGREYEDDMPTCLWCDAPNDGQPLPASDVPTPEQPLPTSNKPQKASTGFFWSALLLGHGGLHCFLDGRNRLGILYLLFGGYTYNFVYHLLEWTHTLCPTVLAYINFVCSPIITILVAKDLWMISLGKYRNHKLGGIYHAKSWMPAIALVGTIIFIIMKLFPVNYIYEAVWNNGSIAAQKMGTKVRDYMQMQEDYFKKTGKIGTQDQLHFIQNNLDIVRIDGYIYRLYGATLDITYSANFHCPAKSKWQVTPSVQGGSLSWEIKHPDAPSCNEMLQLHQRP